VTDRYRYKLVRGSSKHDCPSCGKKRLVRYVDTLTNTLLPEWYGRCDREINCAYHRNPYLENYAWNSSTHHSFSYPTPVKKNLNKPAYIPFAVLNETLTPSGYKQNGFIQNLLRHVPCKFKAKDLEKVISQYYLGTIVQGLRKGSITFPFIDKFGNIRAIQAKQFNSNNHTIATDFLHSILERQCLNDNEPAPEWLVAYNQNERKVSCLFGEHLLQKHTLNPVGLVEAPKTAIYATLFLGFPEQSNNFLWMAVYNLSSLNYEKCKALQGRDVFLFPDLSKNGRAFELWSDKAAELNLQLPGTSFIVSDLLEKHGSTEQRMCGADLADILMNLDLNEFRAADN
jgi:hypothetical protein